MHALKGDKHGMHIFLKGVAWRAWCKISAAAIWRDTCMKLWFLFFVMFVEEDMS